MNALCVVSALLLFAAPPGAEAAWTLNLPTGSTAISLAVYDLHMLIFWICVLIGIAVFGVMGWSIYRHRRSKGAIAHEFHENTRLEIAWTVIPLLVLLGMAIPAAGTLVKMYDTDDAALTIRITGYQWKWRYTYLEDDIDFFSNLSTPDEQIQNKAAKTEHYLLEVDRPLVIPAGKKVRFLLTANDVIHSWWVPALAVKKDAIPGYINEAWTLVPEPGLFRGQCAELCGRNHGFMPIVVEVKSDADYRQWVADQGSAKAAEAKAAARAWSKDELMASGEQLYLRNCAACHQANGTGIANVFPALKGSPVIAGSVDQHIDVVLFGRSGSAMQAFADQLSPAELAAVITYERNAWGNTRGDLVLPAQISAAQKKAAGQ